jgi:hypothetical protein
MLTPMQSPPLTSLVTYRGIDMADIMVTIDADHEPADDLTAGEYHCSTRMADKDGRGAWWRLVTSRYVPAEGHLGTYTDWFPDTHVRPANLDDFVGIMPEPVLEQMRRDGAAC